jgi:hypothetical protein
MTYPYIKPVSTVPLPKNLTLTQFLQTVFVGISAFPADLVRPQWQIEPPKQPPEPTIDWIAIGIADLAPDANGYLDTSAANDGATISQRHEKLEIQCQLYGPNCIDTYGILRDGFQVPNNRIQLDSAAMGFVEITPGRRSPDLVNERWYDRILTSVFIRRKIQRVYPIPTMTSASGVIYVANADTVLTQQWAVS